MARTTAVTAALVLALAACAAGTGDRPGATDDGPGPDDPPTGGSPPADGVPLLEVVVAGGFVLEGHDVVRPPELVVYPDGLAVTRGPQIMVYPPPALWSLVEHDLTAEDLAAVRAAAEDAGLLADPPDYGVPMIADAPTTTVVLHVDGDTHRHEVEALAEAADLVEDPDAAAARERLIGFLDEARRIVTAREDRVHEPDAFAVLTRPVAAGEPPAGEEVGEPQPWPLAVPPTDGEQCVVVDGQDAAELQEALAGASLGTLFTADGGLHHLWARPLLPHEDGCAVVR